MSREPEKTCALCICRWRELDQVTRDSLLAVWLGLGLGTLVCGVFFLAYWLLGATGAGAAGILALWLAVTAVVLLLRPRRRCRR